MISDDQYNFSFFKSVVQKIYAVIFESEQYVSELVSGIQPVLPENLCFVHYKELEQQLPSLKAKQREREVAKKYGAVFIVGIPGMSPSKGFYGDRAHDADDWITETETGYPGLNGDLLVWNPFLEQAMELTSMGIRVDSKAFQRQVRILDPKTKYDSPWHKKLLNNEFPLTVGGGIGLSRTIMFLLRKAHIGEVQPSFWPNEMKEKSIRANISLL